MLESQSVAESMGPEGLLVLGVDTCGPAGTVALARISGENVTILGQKELAGRTYSATLVAAVGDLLAETGAKPGNLSAIVVVNGPGSFTGVRVGVSAVKGLAEPAHVPVVAVSRLAVLAERAGVGAAALDAHRHEVFLRVAGAEGGARELLAGAEELAGIEAPGRVAVCEDAAVELLGAAWPATQQVRVEAPSAADAIRLCVPRILIRESEDLALLDGHYLRRSDAEIFGDAASKVPGSSIREIRIRSMKLEDLERVTQIAGSTQHAPGWSRLTYEKALDPRERPRRVALVAEDGRSGGVVGFAVASLVPPEAELETIVTAIAHQRRGVARELFSSLKNELRRAEVREVVLEVRAQNQAAREFYRFLGFGEVGRRTGYYADPVEDAILMRVSIV